MGYVNQVYVQAAGPRLGHGNPDAPAPHPLADVSEFSVSNLSQIAETAESSSRARPRHRHHEHPARIGNRAQVRSADIMQ
jgi:hypothetical protein